jgi:hypothetical protein
VRQPQVVSAPTVKLEQAKESERERQAKTREQNGLLWIDYYIDLAESLALCSAEYQRRAHALGAALAGRDGRDDA